MNRKNKKQNSIVKINVPAKRNPLLLKAQENINKNTEIKTLWKVINVNAMDRLKMTDHGPIHYQIVANIALKIARMLKNTGTPLSITRDYDLTQNHGELVIFLASILHDLGMSISRRGHEEFSLFLANNLLKEILNFLPIEERTIVTSETLHAIISHRKDGNPLTLEAAIVRVADALDMSEGRSRLPYEEGNVDIHSLSAMAIDKVEIKDGTKKPVYIKITMNNSAGLFQVDELLKSKIKGSGLEKYISVKAYIERGTEKSLIKEFTI